MAIKLYDMKVGKNIGSPLERILHYKLEKFDKNSWKRLCPKCGGLLLVRRNMDTLQIEENDNCVVCGQRYIYKDVERMRIADRGGDPNDPNLRPINEN